MLKTFFFQNLEYDITSVTAF